MNEGPILCRNAEGYNMSIAQLWGSGPMWAITCGKCEVTFQKRIPVTNNPGVACPNCGIVNKLPLKVS